MPIRSELVSITNTRSIVSLGGSINDKVNITMVNNTGAVIFLGGDDVDITNGFPWLSGTERQVELGPGDTLYAVAALAGPYVINVIRFRK